MELETIYEELEKGLNKKIISNTFFLFAIILILALPKIYIANQIYYTSCKINKLKNEYLSLKSENTKLLLKIEKLKFKNRLNIFKF